MSNMKRTVFRGYFAVGSRFVNLDDDYDADGFNWHGTKEEMVEKLFMKLIEANLKPLAFVVFSTCIGFFFGNALVGFLIACTLVAAVTFLA
jgi:hypothetical protein